MSSIHVLSNHSPGKNAVSRFSHLSFKSLNLHLGGSVVHNTAEELWEGVMPKDLSKKDHGDAASF